MQPFTSVIDWSWPLSNRPILASAWRRVALLRVPSIKKVTDPAAKVFSKLPSAVTSSGGPGAAALVADAHINLNLCLGTDANNMRGEP
jgi:hypothetical protein